MNGLEQDLLAASAAGDAAKLVTLYTTAADIAPSEDSAAFFLTQAYVFALESDHAAAPGLRQRLIAAGREEPLAPPLPPRR